MSRRYPRDYPLHFEERCAVIRDICNHTLGPRNETQMGALMRRLMAIAEGNRNAVPRQQRELVRVPYRFARRAKR